MQQLSTGDRYDTADGVPRHPLEYLLLGSRWSVYSLFIKIVLKGSIMARRGTYDDEAWIASSFDTIRQLERCGARFHVEGMDHVRAVEGPVVFVANHMSTLETVTLPGLIFPMKPVTFVVKDKLMRGPVWGPIMRSRNPIAVSRKDPRRDLEAVLTEGPKILAGGRSIIIFPQGTRRDRFDRAELNSLGIKLAARAGVPVIPIALKTDFWGNSPLLRGFGRIHRDRPVHMRFGPSFRVEGRGKTEHESILSFIETALTEWGAEVARQA